MAHYVAEKIKHAESLAAGTRKKNAEKECFSLILDLWKHRWNYKSDRRPLRDFNDLFKVLESLNPDKEEPFFFRFNTDQSEKEDGNSFKPSDLKNLSPMALQIDKVARIWIDYLLREAIAKVGNEKVKNIINNGVKLPDSADAHIIQILFSSPDQKDDLSQFDKEEFDKKAKITTLDRRIGELQKFKEVNEYLIRQYKEELDSLKK